MPRQQLAGQPDGQNADDHRAEHVRHHAQGIMAIGRAENDLRPDGRRQSNAQGQ